MSRWVLEYYDFRELKPTDDDEIVALFLFSLMDEADRKAGKKPDHNQTFWTEVKLSRELTCRGAWTKLSKRNKLKAMFCFARDRIQEAGRKLRQAPMFWTTRNRLEEGPPWDLASVPFPKPSLVVFDAPVETVPPTRKAAGLKSLGD